MKERKIRELTAFFFFLKEVKETKGKKKIFFFFNASNERWGERSKTLCIKKKIVDKIYENQNYEK